MRYQKRLNRTAPNDNIMMPGACEHNAVREYKKCMEEIMNENPNLPVGAQQQMALERCSKLNEERAGKNGKQCPEFLRGMMSKLRIGKDQKSASASHAVASGEKLVALDDTLGTMTFGPSSEESDCDAENNRRCVAIRRRSVLSIAKGSARSINLCDSGEEGSLQDSLEKIEKSSNFVRKSSNRRIRNNRRASVVSELSDVDEDEECKSLNAAIFTEQGSGGPPPQKLNPFEDSVSNILPDEIKLYLDGFKSNKKESCPIQGQRQPMGARSQQDSGGSWPSNFDESIGSLSVDSLNFNGDFSAWNTSRRRIN